MKHVALTTVIQFFNHTLPAGFYCAGGYNSLSPFFVENYLSVQDSNLVTNIYKVVSDDNYILYMGRDYDKALKIKKVYDDKNYRESKFYEVVSGNGNLLYSGPDIFHALYAKDSNDKEVRKLRLLDKKPYKYAEIIEHLSNSGRVAEIVIEPFYLLDNQFILVNDEGKNAIKYGIDGSKKVLLFVSEEFYRSNDCKIKSNGDILLRDKYEINQSKSGLGVIAILDKDQFVAFLVEKNRIIYKWDGNEIIKSFAE